MDGWDFLMGIVNIIPRLPREKFLQRDPVEDFDQIAQSLEKKGLLTESPATGSPSPVWCGAERSANPLGMVLSSSECFTR